mgnify:CR=1 FL=1
MVDDFSELLVGEFLSQGVTKKCWNFEKILPTTFLGDFRRFLYPKNLFSSFSPRNLVLGHF